MHFFGAQPDHVDGKTSMFLFTQVNKRWITHLSIVRLSWWTEGPSFSTQVKICQRTEPGIWYNFPQRPHEIHELHLRFCFPVSNTKLGHGGNLNGKMGMTKSMSKSLKYDCGLLKRSSLGPQSLHFPSQREFPPHCIFPRRDCLCL